MDTIILSIIVPVYNVEKYLINCIDSILNQSINCEIILVDDGSTDNCGAICDQYVKSDKRVKVIHKKNGGLSSARNAGLDIAEGKYITFVDSDDSISPNTYSENIKYMEEHEDIDILEFPTYWNYGTDKANLQIMGPLTFCGEEEIFTNWWRGNPITPAVWNKLYRHNIFDNIRFPENHVFEDLYLITDFSEVAKKIYISTSGIYYYFLRKNSISNCKYSFNKHIDHFTSQFKNYKKLYNYQNLKKERVVAFMRVFQRLITTKKEYPDANISNYYNQLRQYSPSWRDIRNSNICIKEKLRISFLKIVGLNIYTSFCKRQQI
ncbi:MAG: glycosyltransferase [Prevotella sp.]|nr:glycosyltransferase [Prevotella sp.]MBO5156228.1 glycosyltransferase [Prevotella sp.]MBO5204601.1 glycosyltransferase [Prevotella sp.]